MSVCLSQVGCSTKTAKPFAFYIFVVGGTSNLAHGLTVASASPRKRKTKYPKRGVVEVIYISVGSNGHLRPDVLGNNGN